MRLFSLIPVPRPADAFGHTDGTDTLPTPEALALYSHHADDLAAFVEQMLDAEDSCYREHLEALDQQRRALDATHRRRRRALLMLGDRLGAMTGHLDEAAHLLTPQHTTSASPAPATTEPS